MSQEVFTLIQNMNQKNLDTQMALQCAPVIAGLKLSNLLVVSNENFKCTLALLEELKRMGYGYRILLRSGQKTTMLVYKIQDLENYIAKKEIRQFLFQEGYITTELNEILSRFVIRYRRHRMNKAPFPHEMGIFLGYPLTDVVGFIENKGKNFLYNGYWKIYGNLHETIQRFTAFQTAEKIILSNVAAGMNILEIVAYYHNKRASELAG